MKNHVVRSARPFDVDDITIIAKRPYAAKWSREAYAAELNRNDSILLVVDEGSVKAYALARLVDADAQLLDIAVTVDGAGMGRALWAELCAQAKARGAAKLSLEVSSANSRALLFYKRSGVIVVGRRPKFYNDGSDAILMDLPLP